MSEVRVYRDPDGSPYTKSRRRPRTNGTEPGETYRNQLRRLGAYLMKHYNEEIHEGGAVDNAIRILEEHRTSVVDRLAKLGGRTMSDDDADEPEDDQREESRIARPKEGQWVRVVRVHADGVDKLLGQVKAVYKYGGFMRYTIKLPGGNQLSLDERTIKRLDIVTELALLDPEFVKSLEDRRGYDDQGGEAADKTAPSQPDLPDLSDKVEELPSWKPAPSEEPD